MQHLKINTTLQGGKYRIDKVLGEGGFGNTYLGYNLEFEERVAIKEFFMKGVTERDEFTSSVSVSNSTNLRSFEEQKEKFKKEARRLRKLHNDHIVKVHDLFEENGTAYYIMDYIDGESLSSHLKRTGAPLPEEEVLRLLSQLLDALKTVHDMGLWHLDLKPANIMVDVHGEVKLIDFGASKQLNRQKGGATTSTAISYTNGYAPREQMEQNYDKFGPWTDIYALGATVYNLLTNRRPPMPSDIDDDYSADKHNALPFPDNVSRETRNLVLKMMKTNRAIRPQTIEAVMEMMPSASGYHYDDGNTDDNYDYDGDSDYDEETVLSGTAHGARNTSHVYEDDTEDDGKAKRNILIIGVIISLTILLGLIVDSIANASRKSTSDLDEWAVDTCLVDTAFVDTLAADTVAVW